MRKGEVVVGMGLLALGAILLRQALLLPIRWTGVGPGAGFFPFWLSVGVTVTAALILAQSLRSPARRGAAPGGADEPFIPAGAWRPLLVVFLPMVAVIALLDYLGIYLGGGLYLAGYTWFVGRHRPATILLVSLLVPLVLFFIFERWFLLPLPKGSLLEYFLYGR